MDEKTFTLTDFSAHRGQISVTQSKKIKGGFRRVAGVPYNSQQEETTKIWDGIDIRNNIPLVPKGGVGVLPAFTRTILRF